MKEYIKRIFVVAGLLFSELSVIHYGSLVIKSRDEIDINWIRILFDSQIYESNNRYLRSWSIYLFICMAFLFFNLFLSMVHETPKYRSFKLYRYGKDRYFLYCKKKALYGNVYGLLIIAAGILIAGIESALKGKMIQINSLQMLDMISQLLKLFFFIELVSTVIIYFLLRIGENKTICLSLGALCLFLLIEYYIGAFHIITYARFSSNILTTLVLVFIHIVTYLMIWRSLRKISWC